MTIGGILVASVFTLIIIAICVFSVWECCDWKFTIGTIIVSIILIAGIWGGLLWYYNCTESGKRKLKTQESELNGGIIREVKVYDVEGDLVQRYKGKFDVDYDDDRIIFDDENGLRHIIYYPTGTVVIDEVTE